jgi:phosphonate transport system substrate-binding protein
MITVIAKIVLSSLMLHLLVSGPAIAWSGQSGELFRLGIINERPDRPSFALEQYGAFRAYLQSRLAGSGIRVGDLVIARSLEEMRQQIDAGTVDALIEGVMPTLKLERQTGQVDIGLLAWRKGQRHYHTVFFTRRESPIQRIEQLEGKTIAFESPRSTSAYDIPRAALMKAGLRVAAKTDSETLDSVDTDLVWFVFAGSELNQAYWVHAHRADAGAFNNGDWQRVPDSIRSDLRVFHSTPDVLRWVISFAHSVDPGVRASVEDVLVGMHRDPEGRLALQAASGIAKFERLTADDRANLDFWEAALRRLETRAR